MRKAWDYIDAPGVMDAFARTAVTRMSKFDGIFNEHPYSNLHNQALDDIEQEFMDRANQRHEVVLKCLKYMALMDVSLFGLLHRWPPLVVADDLDWLLGIMDSEADEVLRDQLAQLVAILLPSLAGHGENLTDRYRRIERVYEASDRHPELNEWTQKVFYLKLDNPRAVSDREHHLTMKEIEENENRQLSEIQPMSRLHEALDAMDTGDSLQWLNVIYALSHCLDGRTDARNLYNPDLTAFPLWESCDNVTRDQIMKAAQFYVVGQDTVPTEDVTEDWYETSRVPYVELYGYLAIFLLRMADEDALARLSAEKWTRWSKVVVWYPNTLSLNEAHGDTHLKNRGLQKEILKILYHYAPLATLNNLRNLIIAEDRRSLTVGQTLEKLEFFWNPASESMLLGFLQASSLSPQGTAFDSGLSVGTR